MARYEDILEFYENGAAAEVQSLILTLDSDIAFLQVDQHFYIVRALSLLDNSYDAYASLVLEVDLDSVMDSLIKLPWITGATLTIGDQDIIVMSHDMVDRADVSALYAGNIMTVSGVVESNHYSLAYSVGADMSSLLHEGDIYIYLVSLLATLSIPILWFFYQFFKNKVDGPVTELGEFTQEIEQGGFGNQIDAASLKSTEFEALGNNLNAMSAQLQHQFERLYYEELALRDARIKALQSNINPHFLGNTLETINWEARLAGNVKVSSMLESLSTMMEAAIDRSNRPLVHLSEEMIYVNAYLHIIGERLGKRLEVVQELDKDFMDWMVPRLILQPIVENAIEHGITTGKKGTITIRSRRHDEDTLVLEVENDNNFSAEDEQRIRYLLGDELDPNDPAAGKVGIHNVNQRLKMLYDDVGHLTIENTDHGTTLASLYIGKTDERHLSAI